MTIEYPAEYILAATTAEDIGGDTINIDIKDTNGRWCVLYNYALKQAELYRLSGELPRLISVPCSFSRDDMEFFELLSQHYGSTYQYVGERVV